jgi:hypothetical protein
MLFAIGLMAGCNKPQDRGVIAGVSIPAAVVEDRLARQIQVTSPDSTADPGAGHKDHPSRILFGDLHVHTTFSPDAFIMSVPIMGGSGLRSPADACDFARYCSSLDFWSINDHAEGITPRLWEETRQSIRDCDALSGDPDNPDLVSFLGWEWSQVNTDPARHYGHKNVIFRDTADERVPSRAIAAPRAQLAKAPLGRAAQMMLALSDFKNRDFYLGIQGYYDEIANTPICDKGVDSRKLPTDCLELAADPRELFTKLDEWGFDSIVIPHGTSWGMNTPAAATFDKQLNRQQHDPRRQILFEVYSGHGNSEEYRDWRALEKGEDGELYCPAPSDGYLPCCWRAGEIIRERCAADGIDSAGCELRAITARQNFVDAGISGHLTVPGQQVTDWLNCGNCPDCFLEPMDHRPASSAQYALAITDFRQPQEPFNFRFGFIGSSDNHRAMAGTGYKQIQRKQTTEAFGPPSARFEKLSRGDQLDPAPYSIPLDIEGVGLVNLRNMERQNSFWLTGGLVAVHSNGRNRDAIWSGLKRKEVYGTSGDRILLWFDLLQDGREIPMGSETDSANTPRFRVNAVGDFKQNPGCPDHALKGLGQERLERLCGGECYNPAEERHRIERIEVVRIRPQVTANESVGQLIEDPWKTFSCPDDPMGCSIEFEDENFVDAERETIYYARAIQEATPMINADNLRCEYSEQGECIAVNPCYGDYRTPEEDDCLAPAEQRAWSSPIYIEFKPAPAPPAQELLP